MNEPNNMREALEQIEELEESLRHAQDQTEEFRKQIVSGANHFTVPKGATLTIAEGTVIGSLFFTGGTVCHTVGEPILP